MKAIFIKLNFVKKIFFRKKKKEKANFILMLFSPKACVSVSEHCQNEFQKGSTPWVFYSLYLLFWTSLARFPLP